MIINKEKLKEQLKTINTTCDNCEYYHRYCKYDGSECGFTIKDEILNKIIENSIENPFESNKTTHELIDELIKENTDNKSQKTLYELLKENIEKKEIKIIKEAITDYNTAYTNYKNRLNQFKMVYNKKENDLKQTLEEYFKGADITIDEKTIYIKYYNRNINPYTILKEIQPTIKSYKVTTNYTNNETKIIINI